MNLLDQNGTLLSKSTVTIEEGVSIQKISFDLKAGAYYITVARAGNSKTAAGLSDYSVLCILN